MEQQFVSNEVMNDAFENEQVDKIMQSDEFNGNVENAKNILNWMIDLDQKNGLKQIGGKVDLWC